MGEDVIDYEYDQEMEYLYLVTLLPLNVRKTIGHQLFDMVKECTYRGESCLKK